MPYTAYTLRYGTTLTPPQGSPSWIRLYDLEELRGILHERGLVARQAYGGYDVAIPPSEDRLALLVGSEKT